jgi:hypothetical protein
MQKVLDGILARWAEQTKEKGALLHEINILTPSVILSDTINTQTVLIRYDLLRRHVSRVLGQIATISRLPGAGTARVGDQNVSLSDLETSLDDLLAFQLNPLIRRRLVQSLPPAEIALNLLYLEDRIAELSRGRSIAEQRREQLQEVLQSFQPGEPGPQSGDIAGQTPGASVQLNNSFLDRLMDIAGRSGALEYRRELSDRIIEAGNQRLTIDRDISFYEDTLRVLRTSQSRSAAAALRTETAGAGNHMTFDKLQDRVVEILALANQAYEEISTQNLNPRARLYELTSGLSVGSTRAVSVPRILATAGGWFVLVGIVLIGGVATWQASRRRHPTNAAPGAL